MRNEFDEAFYEARAETQARRSGRIEKVLEAAQRAHVSARSIEDHIVAALKESGLQATFTPPAAAPFANQAKRIFTLVTAEFAVRFIVTVAVEPGVGYDQPVHQLELTCSVRRRDVEVPLTVPGSLSMTGEFRLDAGELKRKLKVAVDQLGRLTA